MYAHRGFLFDGVWHGWRKKDFFVFFGSLFVQRHITRRKNPKPILYCPPLFFFTLQVFQSAVGGSFTVCFSLFFSRRLLLVVSLSYLSWILISAAMDNPRSQEDSTQKRIKTSIPFYRRKKEIHRIFIRNREHQPISFFPSFFRNFREGVKMRWGGKEIGTNVKPFAVDCAAMAGEQLLLLEGRRIYKENKVTRHRFQLTLRLALVFSIFFPSPSNVRKQLRITWRKFSLILNLAGKNSIFKKKKEPLTLYLDNINLVCERICLILG